MRQPDLRTVFITDENVVGKTILFGRREMVLTAKKPSKPCFVLDNERCLFDTEGKRLGYLRAVCPLTASIEQKKGNIVLYDKEENIYWSIL